MASSKVKQPTRSFEIAQRRGLAEMAQGAERVRYDVRRDAVILTMRSGAIATIPRSMIPIVNEQDPNLIKNIQLSPMGTSLVFPALDADFAVQGLIRRVFNINEANRLAGATKSPARARASRVNGKKGGRPRRNVASQKMKRG